MIRSVVASSLRFRQLIVAAAAAVIILGVVQLPSASVDVLPEFSPPYVEIQTEALGLSAEEVEQLITVPMEADLLNGVAWLQSIESESVPSLSSIVLTFQPGTDPIRARQMVAERLTQAHALPNVSKPPVMLQPLSSSNRLMMVGLSSDQYSLIDMSVQARWTIRPRLMGVPGVANVAIWGQRERQLQVQIDPQRLDAAGVTIDDVVEAAGNALWVSPLSFLEASTPGTGGFIDTPNQRLGVQHIFPISSPEDLERIPIQSAEGQGYRLSDVATVVEDHQPLIGDAVLNGQSGVTPGLLLVVEKFPEANTLAVTRGVEEAMSDLAPGLRGIRVDTTVFRPATFIEAAIDGLTLAVLIALILMAVALAALLFDWRAALVSLVAIPISLMVGVLVLVATGGTVNALLVAGFVAAVGVLVDDGVSSATTIKRRIAQAKDRGELARRASVIGAVLEVRAPMLYATLILALAITPLFLLGGVSGALVPPLLLSYLLALLASMLVAMTVTPALATILLPAEPAARATSRYIEAIQRAYGALLARLIERPRPIFATAGIVTVAAVALFALSMAPTLGALDAPAFRERDLLVRFDGPPGTSHTEMSRIVGQATNEIRQIVGIRNVGAHVGRAILSDEVSGINTGEIWLSIDSAADYDSTLADLEEVIAGYPGLERQVMTYPEKRLVEIAGARPEDLVVRIFGQDTAVLREKAGQVRDLLAGIDGISAANVEPQVDEASLQVEIDLDAAARYDLKPGEIRRATATLLSGIEVGSLFEEQKVFDVVVWGTPEHRTSVTTVENLPIATPSGDVIRLSDVADVRVAPAATVIHRAAVQRRIDVGATISGRDAGSVLADVEAALATVEFPLENHAEILGITAERDQARSALLAIGTAAAIVIYLLLQAAFGSWRLALLFLLSLPAAVSGAVLVGLALGESRSLGSAIGVLAVLGIAVRHGVQLVAHYRRLLAEGAEEFGIGLVLRGARERMTPMLAAAVATAAAVLPFVIFGQAPGFEIVQPMSLVILGGLVTTILMNFFVVPTIFLGFGAAPAEEMVAIPVEQVPEPQAVGAH
jgi:Cu/Ag efflux pump CusA